MGRRAGSKVRINNREFQLGKESAENIALLSAMLLEENGLAIYILPARLLAEEGSFRKKIQENGLAISAVMDLPDRIFSPVMSMTGSIVALRRGAQGDIFFGKLTRQEEQIDELVENYFSGTVGDTSFQGLSLPKEEIGSLATWEYRRAVALAGDKLGYTVVGLGTIVENIEVGRKGRNYQSSHSSRSLYVPLIGSGPVVHDISLTTAQLHLYTKIDINVRSSSAEYVAGYLNSNIGVSLRNSHLTGATIQRLNRASISRIPVMLPPKEIQKQIISTNASLLAQREFVLGLENNLNDFARSLWFEGSNPQAVINDVASMSDRISDVLRPEVYGGIDRWIEKLPYPLAAILRTWRSLSENDMAQKVSHLLDFFEATAQVSFLVLMSATISNEAVLDKIGSKFHDEISARLDRPTYGTWTSGIGLLAKPIRDLLGSKDSHRVISTMFADTTRALPEMLCNKSYLDVLNKQQERRNLWKGHGGSPSIPELKERHEELLGELQRLRQSMHSGWSGVDLVQAHGAKRRGRIHDTEVSVLMGSNPLFMREDAQLHESLDTTQLYLISKDRLYVRELLPLIALDYHPVPLKNTFYFYNRSDAEGIRVIAYQTSERSEDTWQSSEIREALNLLHGIGRTGSSA